MRLQDQKLEALFSELYASISKKVIELRTVIEGQVAKPLLKSVGQTISKVIDTVGIGCYSFSFFAVKSEVSMNWSLCLRQMSRESACTDGVAVA